MYCWLCWLQTVTALHPWGWAGSAWSCLTRKASGCHLSSPTSTVHHCCLYTVFPRIGTSLIQRITPSFHGSELVCSSLSRGLLPSECWSILAPSDACYPFSDWVIVITFLQGVADCVWLMTGYDYLSLTTFSFNSAKHKYYTIFQFLPCDIPSYGIVGVEGKWDVFH